MSQLNIEDLAPEDYIMIDGKWLLAVQPVLNSNDDIIHYEDFEICAGFVFYNSEIVENEIIVSLVKEYFREKEEA